MPNSLDKLRKQMVYATEISRRTPKFKAHASLAHVKNAVGIRCSWSGRNGGVDCDITVYHHLDNEWRVLWEIPKGTRKEDLPWVDKTQLLHDKMVAQNQRDYYRIQSALVTKHDLAKLADLWKVDVNKPLDDQLDWDWKQYI